MTYKPPENIKRIVYAMNDPYPYIKPNPKWKAYNYNRKQFRKHGFWSSVCWDLDWAVILYLTAAVSLDSPTATDADGDSILATLKSIIARENAWFDFDNDVSCRNRKRKHHPPNSIVFAKRTPRRPQTFLALESLMVQASYACRYDFSHLRK